MLKNVLIIHENLFALYEKNATSLLKIFSTDGRFLSDVKLPGWVRYRDRRAVEQRRSFFGFQSFTVPPSIYMIDFRENNVTELWARVDAPSIDPSAYQVDQVWFSSKDGTKVPMFVFTRKVWR